MHNQILQNTTFGVEYTYILPIHSNSTKASYYVECVYILSIQTNATKKNIYAR